jgi:ADP-L-glycero-D-manno-heptose 6-epimerase
MIVITGGAGFIGSALVAELNRRGRTDLLVVDDVDHERKTRNLRPLRFEQCAGIAEFRRNLLAGSYDRAGITGFLHLGACSDTTEANWDYLQDNNVDYSKDILRWCATHGVRCVYASSAATYGDGGLGFDDSPELFGKLVPLNPYGRSKLVVDIWARDGGWLASAAGVRYFNVFGPNEWHKGGMRSVVNKKFPEVRDERRITLFKSYHPKYADGGQERDFIYVKDAVDATLWLLDTPAANGVFNVGTGIAQTWNDVALAMFRALQLPADIVYVDMPENLRRQYQYHTRADIARIRAAGFTRPYTPLSAAIDDYVRNHLLPDRHLGE